MEHLNAFIAQAAVLLLPGIIWARLDVRYAIKEKPSEIDFILRAFVFGLASYAVTFVVYLSFRQPFALVDVSLADSKNIITRQIGGEIIAATAVGFVLAILWIYSANWKLLSRFLQLIRATKRYGDEDVWDFTFNSTAISVRFVNVRDFGKQIVYTGWVNAFSETDKLRELTLYDVKVYDFNATLLYEVAHLYIARKPDDIHIEFPLA